MSELVLNPTFAPLLVIAVAVALGFTVAGVGLLVSDRVNLRAKLREIDTLYELVDVRDQELMLSFFDRVVGPIKAFLLSAGRRFSPDGYAEKVRIKMTRAGNLDPGAAERFLAIRLVGMAAAPVLFFLCYMFVPLGGMMRLATGALAAFAAGVLPETRLTNQVDARESLVRKQLPDILDLLVICVEAGLGFTAALARTVSSVHGEMSDEFALALAEIKAGASRSEALANLAVRVQIPEVQSFVSSLRQADRFGISISATLRDQAEEMRVRRRQQAQEKAQKAPVKMLIPMVFCIFPPLFIIIIGPAGLQITHSGGF
jgi:tight adherence protein C